MSKYINMKLNINQTVLNFKTLFLNSQRRGFSIKSANWHLTNQQFLLQPTYVLNAKRHFPLRCENPLCGNIVSVRQYSQPTSPPDAQPEPPPKPTLYQRFKAMYRDYWYVLLPVHIVTSAAWFSGFYYMASSGVDIVALLEFFHVNEKVINSMKNGHSTTGYLALSYALYKIATPVRYTVTLGGTTISINYLKSCGYIKPVPSKEKLKEIYQDKKEILKERSQSLKDNMMQSLKPSENN